MDQKPFHLQSIYVSYTRKKEGIYWGIQAEDYSMGFHLQLWRIKSRRQFCRVYEWLILKQLIEMQVSFDNKRETHLEQSYLPEIYRRHGDYAVPSTLQSLRERWHPLPFRSSFTNLVSSANYRHDHKRITYVYGPLGVPLCPTPLLSNTRDE